MIHHNHNVATSTVLENPVWLTSHYELLAVYFRVSFRLLEEADPVVHFLWCVSVAMDHAISSDYNKWVWPEGKKSDEYSTVQPLSQILCSKWIH